MFSHSSRSNDSSDARSISEDGSVDESSSLKEGDTNSTQPVSVIKYGEKRSPGSVFDVYQVTRLLGGSENSGVYLCQRKAKRGYASNQGFWKKKLRGTKRGDDCEEYVLKYLRINTLDNDVTAESLKRFFVKMDKVKALRHPSIVRIHEYFERYGKVYMIMEYCCGGNLASRLPYSEAEAAKMVSTILSAVKAVHNSGMVHGSLNIENIMFVDDNSAKRMEIKLADFGLARALDRHTVDQAVSDEQNYASAPEIFSGTFTVESDIWSIGVICFILLARKAPFSGDAIKDEILRCRYSFNDPVWNNISSDAKDFISNCLELDPSKRLTLTQAMRHRWFSRWLSLISTPNPSIPDEEQQRLRYVVNAAAFKGKGMNIIAQVSSMEKIVDIAQWCFHFDKENKSGMTTFGEFRLGLITNGVSATEIEEIYMDNDADYEDSLEFRDFLAATLEARGRFEETILTETFERSFPEEDTSITKYELAGLLTTVGTPERVEEFFPASEWDEHRRITFKDFLHNYHLKTREYSSKIAFSPLYSITLVMTVNCFAALPPIDAISPHVKYKKLDILGGSEVAAVYVVQVDEAFEVSEVDSKSQLSLLGLQKSRREIICPDQQYAMKTFQGMTPELEYKIRNEICVLQKMKHKSIIGIHESFLDHGQIHMVMDLCSGGNLASRLPYTEQEVVRIVRKLLAGVKYFHDRGVVHSALSMETVLFNSGGGEAEINIVNFGITRKYLNESRFTSEEEDPSLYAASPESFRGVHTKKGDMWSIGVIAFYLLSGLKPFRGRGWLEKLYNSEIEFESDLWSTVSSEAKTFISSLINLDISKRPDAGKAMSYRWIFMGSIPRMVLSKSTAFDEFQGSEVCVHRRGEEFNRAALNVMAQRLADEQLIELINICVGGDTSDPMITCEEFRSFLTEQTYGYVASAIEDKCPDFNDSIRINVVELLNATLGARGHVLQDFYQIDFMNEADGFGGGASPYITRGRLSEMLDKSGACIDVEIIFDTTGLNDDADLITFEEFLRVFRGLRTRVIRERLNSEMVSMTTAISAGKERLECDVQAPSNFDRFKIVDRLGGIDDIVFEVIELSLHRKEQPSEETSDDSRRHYALKIFRLNRFEEPVAKKVSRELVQELKLMKALDHSGIVRIHDISQYFNHVHVVLDLCKGRSLADSFPFQELQVAQIIKEILAALSYLRSENVTHGSLSLENIMFETEDEDSPIKLIGFGLARKYLPDGQVDEVEGELPRTYAWAPESLKERAFNHKTDMWSLGVIAYVMLAGHLPFGERNIMGKIEAGDFDFEHPVWMERSKHAQEFVSWLINVDPEKRPDARRACRHRWLFQPLRVANLNLALVVDPVIRRFSDMLKEQAFQRRTMSCLAFQCTIADIQHLREELRNNSSARWGFVSSTEFRNVLVNCDYPETLISKIFCYADIDGEGLEFDDFLDKLAAASGRIVEIHLVQVFYAMKSKDVSREDIQEVLGEDYDDLHVEEIFKNSKGRMPFQYFLHLFDRHLPQLLDLQSSQASLMHQMVDFSIHGPSHECAINDPAMEDYSTGYETYATVLDNHEGDQGNSSITELRTCIPTRLSTSNCDHSHPANLDRRVSR